MSRRTAWRAARRAETRNNLMGIYKEVPTSITDGIPGAINENTAQKARCRKRRKMNKANQTEYTQQSRAAIASLNIKGFGNSNPLHHDNKWHHVNQLVCNKRLGILVVQETHMSKERRAEVEAAYSRRLRIFALADREKPTAQAGIAVVFNRNVITDKDARAEELIPGRVMMATFKLWGGIEVRALAIYAYNDPRQNANLWRDLQQVFEDDPDIPRPNMMLRDFNMVEDAVDRLPAHNNPEGTVTALGNLKSLLSLQDGWRETFPDQVAFTYMQGKIHLRIDWMYMTKDLLDTLVQWAMGPSGIANCDHEVISVMLTDPKAPGMASGRPVLPLYLLKDSIFIKDIIKLGIEATDKMELAKASRTSERNPQTVYATFKEQVWKRSVERDNEIVPKLLREMKEVEEDLKQMSKDRTLDDAVKETKMSTLKNRLKKIAEKRHSKRRQLLKMKYCLEGESMTKVMASMGKEKKPCDIMWGLKSGTNEDGQPIIEQDLIHMSKIA
jgi:hypothetical protein